MKVVARMWYFYDTENRILHSFIIIFWWKWHKNCDILHEEINLQTIGELFAFFSFTFRLKFYTFNNSDIIAVNLFGVSQNPAAKYTFWYDFHKLSQVWISIRVNSVKFFVKRIIILGEISMDFCLLLQTKESCIAMSLYLYSWLFD